MASTVLEAVARDVLEVYGDPSLGEWTEDRPQAFHLRRRLSASEQLTIGEAVDLRGTNEAKERLLRIRNVIPPRCVVLGLEELA